MTDLLSEIARLKAENTALRRQIEHALTGAEIIGGKVSAGYIREGLLLQYLAGEIERPKPMGDDALDPTETHKGRST